MPVPDNPLPDLGFRLLEEHGRARLVCRLCDGNDLNGRERTLARDELTAQALRRMRRAHLLDHLGEPAEADRAWWG